MGRGRYFWLDNIHWQGTHTLQDGDYGPEGEILISTIGLYNNHWFAQQGMSLDNVILEYDF